MMADILVSRKIPENFIKQLKKFGEVEMWNDEYEVMPREAFLKSLKHAKACFITLSEKIDE